MPTDPVFIDPTYLRFIRDGLSSVSFRPDNPTALPEGLVSLYEEAVPVAATSRSREKTMAIWSVWALLQKEASAQLVTDILGCPLAEILDHLAVYSKWFNAPACGQYALYHERLRAFVLQKISTDRFKSSQTAIIQNCRAALLKKAGDEWECYALEHLGRHLFLQAMQAPQTGKELMDLAYDDTIWSRQLEIGKSYLWTKKMLDDTLHWAVVYDPEQLVECSLKQVDLHYLEQNDANRIVNLIAQNDLRTALSQIESFGTPKKPEKAKESVLKNDTTHISERVAHHEPFCGKDKNGLQRKFTLYMLCLMELTLLESKEKPFRRSAIEQLLQHLDENLPVNHSVLNWNDFFSSYLVFLMACEWAELGLEYRVVYKRTGPWKGAWITEKGPYTDQQLKVLDEVTNGMESMRSALSVILAKQGRADQAFAMARELKNDSEKCVALAAISTELAKRKNNELAEALIQEALYTARNIGEANEKSAALTVISSELYEQGLVEAAGPVMQEAKEAVNAISDNKLKCMKIIEMGRALIKQGKSNEAADATLLAWNLAKEVNNEEDAKSNLLGQISTLLLNLDKAEDAAIADQEALAAARSVRGFDQGVAKLKLAFEWVAQGKIESAKNLKDEVHETTANSQVRNHLKDFEWKCITLEHLKQDDLMMAKKAIEKMIDKRQKNDCLFKWIVEIAPTYNINSVVIELHKALKTTSGIVLEYTQTNLKKNIFKKLIGQGKLDIALEVARSIKRDDGKTMIQDLSLEWAKAGEIEKAINLNKEANKNAGIAYSFGSRLNRLSVQLAQQGHYDQAIEVVQYIPEDHRSKPINRALLEIAAEFAIQNSMDLDKAALLIKDRYKDDRPQDEKSLKNKIMTNVCRQLAQTKRTTEALRLINNLNDETEKMHLLQDMARNAENYDLLAEEGPQRVKAMETIGEYRRYLEDRCLQEMTDELDKMTERERAFKTAI